MIHFFSKRSVRPYSNSILLNVLVKLAVLITPLTLHASLMDQFVLTIAPNNEIVFHSPDDYSVLQIKVFDTDRIAVVRESDISDYLSQGSFRKISSGLSKTDAAKIGFFLHKRLQSFLTDGACAIIPITGTTEALVKNLTSDAYLALHRFKNFVVGPNGSAELQEISAFID